MSEIKAGDLVQIVGCHPSSKPHCEPYLGLFRTVSGPCPVYLGNWDLLPVTINRNNGFPISWASNHLKRIDPPATGDEVSTRVPLKRDARLPA